MTLQLARWFRRASIVGAFAAAVASCAKDESAGQITVVIQTDFAMPKDLDYVRLEVRSDGMPLGTETPPPLYRNDYPVDPSAPPDLRVTIPATFAVINTKGAVEPIAVRVSAGHNGKVRVLRDALTSVPPDRNAMLRMYLQWLSDGSAVAPAAGAADPRAATSACPAGQTNIAGLCTDAHVDVGALPNFDSIQVYGGATPASGVGFDVLSCFASPMPVMLDDSAGCAFSLPAAPPPGQLNVALELPAGSDGVCNAAHCIVALDRQDAPAGPVVGWSVAGTTVQLPPGVCARAKAVPKMRVVASQACPSKTAGAPACGPPSAAKDCSIHGPQDGDAGTPYVPPTGPSVLSLGHDHTCLSSGNSVRCWGNNALSQTGKSGGGLVVLPNTQAADLGVAVTGVSAGLDVTCAIAGKVFCWGGNRYGQRGTAPQVPAADDPQAMFMAVTAIGQPPKPQLVAASTAGTLSHVCASGGGKTNCWGSNTSYQLGDTTSGGGVVSTLSLAAQALALGDRFTCAVDDVMVVRCWGQNDVGQLGAAPGAPMPYVPGPPSVSIASTSVVAGADFACSIATDSSVWCWGNGQSGVPTGTKSPGAKTPTMVFTDRVTQIAAGDDFACAIIVATPQDHIHCWGNNSVGQLGKVDQMATSVDVVLPTGFEPPFDQIVAGGQRACVVAGQRVVCWGANDFGQIDSPTSAAPSQPHAVDYPF